MRATVIPAASFSPVADSNGNGTTKGLTSDVAQARLEKDGPNATPDITDHPLRNAFAKCWAPVPWLLEASVVLEIVLHKYYEAGVIASLLVFNAALAYFQESRARATLAALKSRLALSASVERDGTWKTRKLITLVLPISPIMRSMSQGPGHCRVAKNRKFRQKKERHLRSEVAWCILLTS